MKTLEKDPARSLEAAIKDFIRQSPENRLQHIDNTPIFEEPLVAFASGDEPLFSRYKEIIGDFHLTPREALERAGSSAKEVSVVSWVLPIARETRLSNRKMKEHPSLRWAHTRWYGEQFNESLRRYLVDFLQGQGYQAVAPVVSDFFEIITLSQGIVCNWSERHVAYAAGLGTFSLSDGFITPKGIAMRCGSVVTDLKLPPSPRPYPSYMANCPFLVDGSCGVCIERCPAEAITPQGHSSVRCYDYWRDRQKEWRKEYNVGITGCGLCQTKVPCEDRIPPSRQAKPSTLSKPPRLRAT